MTGLAWLLESVLLGVVLVSYGLGVPRAHPTGLRLLFQIACGAICGIGLSSCLFFVSTILVGNPWAAVALELAALAGTVYALWRRRLSAKPVDGPGPRFSLLAPISLAVMLAVAFATFVMTIAWRANLYGDWDAWALWNLRAKMLAAGDGLVARAWSPILSTTTHPEYPLLLSSFIARCWSLSHSSSQLVPIATSYVFFLSLIAVVWAGIGILRTPVVGGLAALVIATTPSLLRQVPYQYADIPLACFMAAAIGSELLDYPVLAGAFAGMSAWTKNEGVLFLFLFLALVAVMRRQSLLRTSAAALPAAVLAFAFKLSLPRGTPSLLSQSLPQAGNHLLDGHRYLEIIQSFARGFLYFGNGWYHPLLPLLILAIAWRVDRGRWRDATFCGLLFAGLLGGYFGIFLITSNSVEWLLRTSLDRLLVQVWPVLVMALACTLRVPEIVVPIKVEARPKSRRKVKR